MSNRTERREAERIARKLAYKQLQHQRSNSEASPAQEETPISDIECAADRAFIANIPVDANQAAVSDIQLAANRANALLSTGPVTSEGRARSSRNALKHALTGETVLLPTDNVEEYNDNLNAYLESFHPATDEEIRLVQSLVDTYWRLTRIRRLETGILLKGQLELADKFQDKTAVQRRMLIDTDTFLRYEKSIRTLHTQEARLLRRAEKDQAELFRIQAIRKRDERITAEKAPAPDTRKQNGFEFSNLQNKRECPSSSHQFASPQPDLLQTSTAV